MNFDKSITSGLHDGTLFYQESTELENTWIKFYLVNFGGFVNNF